MPYKRISLIIPAFNEFPNISDIGKRARALFPDCEIILVDDGSTDSTARIVKHSDFRIIHHPLNIGNGAAVKSGIRAASGETVIFMDGDGQHDPVDIPTLLEHMDKYDMVVGARTSDQQASLPRRFMNRIFNRLASYITSFQILDLTSGFRALRAVTAREMLPLLPNGYSWPTTTTMVALRSGLSVKYVPINVRPRQHGRSRIRPMRDSTRIFLIIMKICTLYSPLRIFLPVSGGIFLLGLINYGHTYFTSGRFTNMSAVMFIAAVIIFLMGLISEQISQINMLRLHINPRDSKAELKESEYKNTNASEN